MIIAIAVMIGIRSINSGLHQEGLVANVRFKFNKKSHGASIAKSKMPSERSFTPFLKGATHPLHVPTQRT